MLTRQRHEMILRLLQERGSITALEIKNLFAVSEATARRDITALDKAGKLCKVFGGAVQNEVKITASEYTVARKTDLNCAEKRQIAAYAATLIQNQDFVYLDAGTTTAYLIDYLEPHGAVFVTNGVIHAQRLSAKGIKVILIGGELKASTEAVVGNQALLALKNFHFTLGFFGANGVDLVSGCTTSDSSEATIKQTAMQQSRKTYVLCDNSKFDRVSSVTFAPFNSTTFITDKELPGYKDYHNIIVV